jgi:hypothetical protein
VCVSVWWYFSSAKLMSSDPSTPLRHTLGHVLSDDADADGEGGMV